MPDLPLQPTPAAQSTATSPDPERDAEPEGPCATPREDVMQSELADHPFLRNTETLAEQTRFATERDLASPNPQRSKLDNNNKNRPEEKEEDKLPRFSLFFFFF